MTYLDPGSFKAAVFPEGTDDTADDTRIQLVLDAGTALIDDYCGRTFGAITVASIAKVFLASSANVLEVPDLQTVTSILLDTNLDRTYPTALNSTTDYDLWPYEGPPYTQIRIRRTATYGIYPGLMVKVTGKWGYAATVPAAIKEANLLISNRLWERQRAPFGMVESVNFGLLARIQGSDIDVEALLAPYRVAKVWAIA